MTARPLALLLAAMGAPPAALAGQGAWTIESVGPGIYLSVVSDSSSFSQFANSLIVVGDEGVLVVDSRDTEDAARELLARIRDITDKPVRYLINTHWHWDHVNGNAAFLDAFPDLKIIAHPETIRLIGEEGPGRVQSEIDRLSNRRERLEGYRIEGKTDSGRALTEDDYIQIEQMRTGDAARIRALTDVRITVPNHPFEVGWTPSDLGRDVHLIDSAPAHTAGDLAVWVPDAALLFLGDLIEFGFPFPGDGTASGHADRLNELAALDARRYLPAHGPATGNEAIFEGQRSFWNDLNGALESHQADSTTLLGALAEPDSTAVAVLVDRLVAAVDPGAFPGSLSQHGQISDRFREWAEGVVRQALAEGPSTRR